MYLKKKDGITCVFLYEIYHNQEIIESEFSAATASDKVQSSSTSTSEPGSSAKSHFSFRKHKAKSKAVIQEADAASEPSTSQQMIPSPASNQIFDNNGMPTSSDQNNNANDKQMRQHRMDFDAVDNSGGGGVNVVGGGMAHGNIEIEMKTMDSVRSHKRQQSIGTKHVVLAEGEIKQQHCGCIQIPIEHADIVEDDKRRMAHDVSSLTKKNSLFFLFLVNFFRFFRSSLFFFIYFLVFFFLLIYIIIKSFGTQFSDGIQFCFHLKLLIFHFMYAVFSLALSLSFFWFFYVFILR